MAKKKKKRKLTAADIKVKKTPMPKRTISNSKIGRVHRMVLSRFLQNLFILNCTFPPSKKMTDGEIARQVRQEYKHLENGKIAERFSEDNIELSTVISKYRSEYNRGKLIPSVGPPMPEKTSFAYNEKGEPVNTRFNIPKPLTPDEVQEQREKTKARRDKFLKGNPELA